MILPDGLDDADAPDALVCPITQELMTEPALVVTSGRTYQRGALLRWVREHGTDPLQRNASLRESDLAPNLAVRQMVEDYARAKNGGSLPDQAPAPAPAPGPATTNNGPTPDDRRPDEVTLVTPAFAPSPDPPPGDARVARTGDERELHNGICLVVGLWSPHSSDPGARRPIAPLPDGRFFRVDRWRLGPMIARRFGVIYGSVSGSRSNSGGVGAHVKDGGGATLRCVNRRSGKSGAVLIWEHVGGQYGVGCWNPAEYAEPGDFREGDELFFPDLAGEELVRRVLPRGTRALESLTRTGWNLPARESTFGRCGLVGDFWRELVLEERYAEPVVPLFVYTDAPLDLPTEVWYEDHRTKEWVLAHSRSARSESPGATIPLFGLVDALHPRAVADAVKVVWGTTDLHATGGLSTARSGGGLHAHFGVELATAEQVAAHDARDPSEPHATWDRVHGGARLESAAVERQRRLLEDAVNARDARNGNEGEGGGAPWGGDLAGRRDLVGRLPMV